MPILVLTSTNKSIVSVYSNNYTVERQNLDWSYIQWNVFLRKAAVFYAPEGIFAKESEYPQGHK